MATRKRSSSGFSSEPKDTEEPLHEAHVEPELVDEVQEVLEDIETLKEFLEEEKIAEPEPEPKIKKSEKQVPKAAQPNPEPIHSKLTRPRRNIPRFSR